MPGRILDLWTEFWRTLGDLLANHAWRRIAFFLLPYAGVLAGMDVAVQYGSVTDALLPAQMYLSKDESFGEYLEYSLTAATAIMLFLLWLRARGVLPRERAALRLPYCRQRVAVSRAVRSLDRPIDAAKHALASQ
ncbi:hypothetical protein [Erythrobacter mangrovi]|uniref:Uncharacterized protein n=1 Tax=Erythrobacter mangrovi TaxID=2739433 RepID=A0A7D3XA51_9SPHN|nr:hypothetical protein [Erythrobacter mangrovi]QKG70550.1 hypothetical protein HQR01_03750 [Erythrobacter mangrovi]